MNLPFLTIEPFFHFLSILILIYLTFSSLFKYIKKRDYSLFDFRVSIFCIIFYAIDLILNTIKEEVFSTALAVGLVFCVFGLIIHNEQVKKDKKFLRLFIFFGLALFCSILSAL
tara:strand:- start:102 stop:443 length:342 start_codon:yes stop_codon:yes gene_type:complete